MKKILILCVLVLHLAGVSAQVENKTVRRTYLWDVTLSMQGKAAGCPDIWDVVKQALVDEIRQVNDERTEIVIIPFQHRAIEEDMQRSMATPEGKQCLIQFVNNYKIPRLWSGSASAGHELAYGSNAKNATTMTKLYAPLRFCLDKVLTKDKVNVLELMTDGRSDFEDDDVAFKRLLLGEWCDIASERDIYTFYVMLAPMAKDTELENRSKACERFDIVDVTDGPIDVSIVELIAPKSISFNIHDDYKKPISLRFTKETAAALKSGFKVRAYMRENPFMSLDQVVDVAAADCSIQLKPKYLMTPDEMKDSMAAGMTDKVNIYFEPAPQMDSYPYSLIRVRDGVTDMKLICTHERKVTINWK